MSRQNKKSLYTQAYETLQSKQAYGHSKHDDKILGLDKNRIYSYSTMQSYLKQTNRYIAFCKNSETVKTDLGHTPKTLSEIKPYVQDFVNAQIEKGCSAYTIKLQVSALSKLYGERLSVEIPKASRQDIKRSRGEAVRDKGFNEVRNADFVNVCRCVGFRRHELTKAVKSDLVTSDGQFYMRIVGKGGRERYAPLVGSPEEIQQAVDYIQSLNGKNQVFSHADVHSYRGDYATKIYLQNARPIDELKGSKIDYTALTGKRAKDGSHIYKSAVYACRGDRKGVLLDRRAMIMASQALGHNRESVVGEHYIKL